MTDTLKLKVLMLKAGYTQLTMADALGLSAYCFHKKLHNLSVFKVPELEKIIFLLGIKSAATVNAIFFGSRVDFTSTSED